MLPDACTARVTIEAATTFGWHRHAGLAGLTIGIDHFGHSAPAGAIKEKYGLTPQAVATKVTDYLG